MSRARRDDGLDRSDGHRRPSRSKLWHPPPGPWLTSRWRVFLPGVALIVALPAVTGAYVSAGVILLAAIIVLYLRVRDRRQGLHESN